MKRFFYYMYKIIALCSRVTKSKKIYMFLLTKAHKVNGVKFIGRPNFIHPSSVLDTTAGITLGENIVISTGVLCLTHDYSFTTGLISIDKRPETDKAIIKSVTIGNNCFIGANSTILPGSTIGDHTLIGAGSIVRGNIPNFSVVSGNPANVVYDIRKWAKHKNKTLCSENILSDKF